MLALFCFCVATEFSVNKDLHKAEVLIEVMKCSTVIVIETEAEATVLGQSRWQHFIYPVLETVTSDA